MNKKLIIANWKMQPTTLEEAEGILGSINGYLSQARNQADIIICPPFVFIEDLSEHRPGQYAFGAQDISVEDSGAFTGEISGPMLQKIGVRYVIVGHSERRWKLGESDEVVNGKIKAALRNGLVPIVCIGERSRDGDYKKFLEEQVEKTFAGLSPEDVSKCIVAYEPVWAISSNPGAQPDTAESALESIQTIKDVLIQKFQISDYQSNSNSEIQNFKPRFLYGGSVNSKNAADFLKEEEIGGVLVGSASVNKEEFVKILEIAAKI